MTAAIILSALDMVVGLTVLYLLYRITKRG